MAFAFQAEKWSKQYFKNVWQKKLYHKAKELNVVDSEDKMQEFLKPRTWVISLKEIEFTNKVRGRYRS